MTFELVRPGAEHLTSYVAALKAGAQPVVPGVRAASERLAAIEADPVRFLEELEDREGKLPPSRLPDGTETPRLASLRRWMWDGEFAGSISFRWQLGTPELPPTCLGHIGYWVVPWKRRRGYATEALRRFIPEIRFAGLPFVEIVTDADNRPSERVIEANGGVLHERFLEPAAFGGTMGLRFRIRL